jgi:hypothetical protein
VGVEEFLWYLEKVCDEELKLCGVLHLRYSSCWDANQRWQTIRGGHDQSGQSRIVLF